MYVCRNALILNIYISANGYLFFFWTLPFFCVESLIEKFNRDHEKEKNGPDGCQTYQKLSRVFSSLLLLFYFYFQFLMIVVIFSSIAKFVNQDSRDIIQFLMFFGNISIFGENRVRKIGFQSCSFVRRKPSQPDRADPDSGVGLRLSAECCEEERGEIAEDNTKV